MATKIKLAEALLRRKELQAKVDQLKTIKAAQVFDLQVKRVKITDNIDEVTANVPKLTASQVTAEHDYYAKALRQVDAGIQHANWTTEIEVPDNVMPDYSDGGLLVPAPKQAKAAKAAKE